MEYQKPRLAILASRFPFPVEKGDKLRLYHQLKQLSHDYEVYLFALTDEVLSDRDRSEVDRYCTGIFVYQDRKITRNLRVIGYFKDWWPAQVRYFYSPEIHRRFLDDFFKINADIIYCQLYRMTPYLAGIRAPKVLDVMDNFASIATLHADHSRRFYDRLFWKREYDLIQRYERKLLSQFDHITVISERDAQNLNPEPAAKVTIVRNGIDVDYFQSYPEAHKKQSYDIGFFGNLDYKPNREGVRYLIQEILPYFRLQGHKVKTLIGGKGAKNLRTLANDHPDVSFHDWYDDIRDAYYSVQTVVVPLFLGSGMQNKVLEALASNRRVICTSHVINGMPMLRDHVQIANSPEEFLKQYQSSTSKDGTEREQSSSIAVLKNDLTWDSQCDILKQVLDDTRENYRWDFTRYH